MNVKLGDYIWLLGHSKDDSKEPKKASATVYHGRFVAKDEDRICVDEFNSLNGSILRFYSVEGLGTEFFLSQQEAELKQEEVKNMYREQGYTVKDWPNPKY